MALPSVSDFTFTPVSDVASVSIDVPVHASGDVLFLVVSIEDNSSSTPTITATGWTSFIADAWGASARNQFYFQAISTPLVTISISFSVAVNAAVLCFVGQNINNADVIEDTQSDTNSGLIHTVGAVTTTLPNSLIIGAFLGPNPGTYANSLPDLTEIVKSGRRTVVSDPGGEMTVGWRLLGAAGSSGIITTTLTSVLTGASPVGGNSRAFQIAVNPSEAPTKPVVLTPASGDYIAIGRTTYAITWTPSTDPNISPSLLTYEIDYTNNDALTWVPVAAPTSAGVSTFTWNTTTLTAGTYKLRIRAYNGTEYSGYAFSSNFYIIADATPSKPTGLSPASGYIDRTITDIFSWVFNDPGDLQKSYYIEYSVNADMSSSSNTGEQTTATAQHSFAGATFSAGYLYWRVKTKGLVDSTYSAFSDIATVLVATPPATPNITAPVAASPPTTGNPTITWTSTGQVKYRIQVKEGGVYVYQGSWISSSQKSVTSPYTFKNSVSTVLYVAIQDSNGLSSAEDSETFTPSFTPPNTPTIAVDVFDGIGAVQIAITNTGSLSGQYVYRYITSEGATTAIKISPLLPANATFLDYQAKSGTQYTYYVKAFHPTSGGFADSATATATPALTSLHIHTLTRTSLTSNANLTVVLRALTPMTRVYEQPSVQWEFTGREAEVTGFSQTDYLRLSYNVFIPTADTITAAAWNAVFAAKERVCVRDPKGNKIFGKVSRRVLSDVHEGIRFELTAVEEDFTEALL